jgi:hypothetical protein
MIWSRRGHGSLAERQSAGLRISADGAAGPPASRTDAVKAPTLSNQGICISMTIR